jgi:hypothetical protein
MVLSTNFYKVAKSAIVRKRKVLTKEEKIDLQAKIVRRNLFINIGLLIVIAVIITIIFAYFIVAFISNY